MKLNNTDKKFLSYNIYDNASPALLFWIKERAITREYDRACSIIEEGKIAKAIYIVESGPVKVFSNQSNGSKVLLSTLEKGNIVGEMSWLEDRPAMASVEVESGCYLLEIPTKELNQIKNMSDSIGHLLFRMLAEKLALQLQMQNAWIHRNSINNLEPLRKVLILFAELNELDVSWLANTGYYKRLPSGEYLLRQGEEVRDLYLILSGDAQISISIRNELKYVGSSCKGEILGEISMLSPVPIGAAANVSSKHGMELLVIDIKKILAILNSNQNMAYRFYKGLSKMLSQRCRDQLLIAGYSLNSRLAEDEIKYEHITDQQLSDITTAGTRFDWLCRQFQNKEG